MYQTCEHSNLVNSKLKTSKKKFEFTTIQGYQGLQLLKSEIKKFGVIEVIEDWK